MELKAKDGYRSEVLRPLGADALNSLMSLYQPLVGCAGAALYLTLISEAKHQRSFSLYCFRDFLRFNRENRQIHFQSLKLCLDIVNPLIQFYVSLC